MLTTLGKGFWVAPVDDLASGRHHPLEFANLATFSPDSRQVALASWNVGEIWDVEALVASGS